MRLVLATILALVVVLPPPFWGRAEAGGGIVSVGGAVTEIVYALGQEDRLLAVDTTSLYPAATGELPNVGYMRQLSAAPIPPPGPRSEERRVGKGGVSTCRSRWRPK